MAGLLFLLMISFTGKVILENDTNVCKMSWWMCIRMVNGIEIVLSNKDLQGNTISMHFDKTRRNSKYQPKPNSQSLYNKYDIWNEAFYQISCYFSPICKFESLQCGVAGGKWQF